MPPARRPKVAGTARSEPAGRDRQIAALRQPRRAARRRCPGRQRSGAAAAPGTRARPAPVASGSSSSCPAAAMPPPKITSSMSSTATAAASATASADTASDQSAGGDGVALDHQIEHGLGGEQPAGCGGVATREGGARGHHLETAASAAAAERPVGIELEMPDLPGQAMRAQQRPAIADHRAANPGAEDDHEEVVRVAPGAKDGLGLGGGASVLEQRGAGAPFAPRGGAPAQCCASAGWRPGERCPSSRR